MVAVVMMVEEEEANSGEGEGEGELKQASRELAGLLFSTAIMLKRSRPEDAAVELQSDGAKGSLGRNEGECDTWR